MKLLHRPSGKSFPAIIKELSEKDFQYLKESIEFQFDWSTEKELEVYKIFLTNKQREILGVMSLMDLPDEYRIHLNLLEVSKHNQGGEKQFDFIAGCLIAFAAETAFLRGYFGFVSLEPKTKLIPHYKEKYGFEPFGRYLAIDGNQSQVLIDQYLEDE